MKTCFVFGLYLGCFVFSSFLWAQDVDESELFGDKNSVVKVELESILLEKESVTFSGESEAKFGYDITRSYLDGDTDFGDNPYSTSIDGDFLLDVRLLKGIKSFGDLAGMYTPQDDPDNPDANHHFQTTLKEFFVDVNIAWKVYLRFGKQNLKWGQGYLWNPTDLISEDRKDFSDMDARREGVRVSMD